MAVKSFFTILKDNKFMGVQGWQISLNFACQLEKDHGYRITHIPTGFLLTNIGFSSVDVAKTFAELCETVFGNKLAGMDAHVLNILSRINPVCKSLYEGIKKMNVLSKTKPIISDTEFFDLFKEFSGGQ